VRRTADSFEGEQLAQRPACVPVASDAHGARGAVVPPMPLDEVDTAAVLAVLKPHWQKTPETASRLRGRIEAVIDYARAHGWRNGENPAAWRGHLALILPRRTKLSKKHLEAMPYAEVPGLV
jgi:hypothetical protein